MYFSILGHFEIILIADKTDYVVQLSKESIYRYYK